MGFGLPSGSQVNQEELYGNIKDVFECAAREGTPGVEHSHHKQVNKDHGQQGRWKAGEQRVLGDNRPGMDWPTWTPSGSGRG